MGIVRSLVSTHKSATAEWTEYLEIVIGPARALTRYISESPHLELVHPLVRNADSFGGGNRSIHRWLANTESSATGE